MRSILLFVVALAFATQVQGADVSFEKDASLPIVYLNVALKTGAVTDPDGLEGLTSFTGEMLLRGTKNRDKEQIDLELDQLGSSLEVETRAEALILRGAVLSKNLDRYLELIADIITRPNFPEREIAKLKSKTISGLLKDLGNDSSLGMKKHEEFLFGAHPFGNPIAGKLDTVKKFKRKDIESHYQKLFHREALVVVGTGDTTLSAINSWAEELSLPDAGGEAIPKLSKPTNPLSRQLMIVDKPDRTQTWIFAGQVGVTLTDKDYFALYVGNYAFGGAFTSRMMEEIRVKRGWSYGAYSLFRHGTVPRIWTFYLFPAEKDSAPALKTALGLVETLREKGITQAEFDFATNSLINSDGFRYDTPKKRVENKLLELTLNLPDGFMQTYAKRIAQLKVDDVNSALSRFLAPERLSITVVATAKNLKSKLAKAADVPESLVKVVDYSK